MPKSALSGRFPENANSAPDRTVYWNFLPFRATGRAISRIRRMALNSKAKPEMAKMAEFRELGECSGPCNQLALLMVDKLGSEPLWCS
eukprot:COSAG02_NODE_62941_length_264_cov_0.945455_1_plen_87_part_11